MPGYRLGILRFLIGVIMFRAFSKVLTDVRTPSFSLGDLPGFPYDQYVEQLTIYEKSERWFTGAELEEKVTVDGKPAELYPLKINKLMSTVLKHAYILFGEVEDNGRPLVFPTMIRNKRDDKAEKQIIQEAENALNHVWWENNGRAIMLENGILSQIYGGCVFKATYVPWEAEDVGGFRKIPIRIERINPKGFIGIPDSGDNYRLLEGWIVREISETEARKWGYEKDELEYFMVEKWTRTEHQTWINLQPATFTGADGTAYLLNENPFGEVPIVYIPHIRVGNFLGINAIDHLRGLVQELNLRMADFGDAVNDDSHTYVAIRNVQGLPQIRRIADGLNVIDLGSSPNISGQEPDPDAFEVRKQRASTAMKELVDEIKKEYRSESFVPAIADGEDEGSQRSALTLVTRFYPLVAHAQTERVFWSCGLDVFQPMILRIMKTKSLFGIEEKHTLFRMRQKWANPLPRDREVDVQEWVQRVTSNLGSIDHLMSLAGDIDDIDEQKQLMLDWIKQKTEVVAKTNAEFAPAPAPFGNSATKPKPSKPVPPSGTQKSIK